MAQPSSRKPHPPPYAKPSTLKIPDFSSLPHPTTWTSPRSIYGFPRSPSIPHHHHHPHLPLRNTSSAPVISTPLPPFPWTSAGDFGQSFSYSAPSSPAGPNPSAQSLTKCATCGESRNSFNAGTFVFVKCNNTKWLLGQVKSISHGGIRVWIGSAQVLVEVPFSLVSTHLSRIGMPISQDASSSSSSSSSSCHHIESPQQFVTLMHLGSKDQIFIPLHVVRPAHLSHRQLYRPAYADGSVPLLKDNKLSMSNSSFPSRPSAPVSNRTRSMQDTQSKEDCFGYQIHEPVPPTPGINKSKPPWKARNESSGDLQGMQVLLDDKPLVVTRCKSLESPKKKTI